MSLPRCNIIHQLILIYTCNISIILYLKTQGTCKQSPFMDGCYTVLPDSNGACINLNNVKSCKYALLYWTYESSFIRVLYIPANSYCVILLSFYVFIADAESNITEIYGDQSRCYEHSDECNSTVSFSCLATQVVRHKASGLLAYYVRIDGRYYYC